jgi:hypothetical protein
VKRAQGAGAAGNIGGLIKAFDDYKRSLKLTCSKSITFLDHIASSEKKNFEMRSDRKIGANV